MPTATPRLLLLYRRYSSSFTAYPAMLAADGKFDLDVVAPAKHLVRHSVWVQSHFPADTDEEFLQAIELRLETGEYAGLWCIDEPSRELVFSAPQVNEWAPYLPFGDSPSLRCVAVDKNAFYIWCRELGIPCPESVYAQTAKEAEALATSFRYPFVVKGAHGAGGLEVDIVRSAEQFQILLQDQVDRQGWVLQEFIDGLVGTTTFVANDRKLYLHYSVMNRACMRDGTGPSMLCEPVEDLEITRIIEQIVVDGGVSGLTGFDWIQRADGSYTVIDPHFGRVVPNAVVGYRHGLAYDEAVLSSLQNTQSIDVADMQRAAVWVFPQALQLLFEPDKWYLLIRHNPLSNKVQCFVCGRGEWRLFLAQTVEFCWGRFRVVAGAIKARITGKSLSS